MDELSGQLQACVVLFVDISGSSRLYREIGDALAARRVRECLDRLRQVVETYHGRVIKNMGDGLMCHFGEAHQALEAAAAMQIAIDSPGDTGPKLGIHVGCHFGHVLERAGDLFGDTVNIAARVANVAREGQIIATRETIQRLDDTQELNARLLLTVSVKGRREAITVFEYLWRKQGELTVMADQPAATIRSARLKLAFGGREVYLDASAPGAISLGREPSSDVPVIDREASRHHATIEVRGDKFVLLDHSSNGTFIASDGAVEIWLRREEMILPARGRIALGLSTAASHATRVEFLFE
jgi:adenylate cyclase